MEMDNNTRSEFSSNAFQIWMGQWRINTLDTEGCMFVLRFLLRAFRSRRPEDMFWSFLERFLFAEVYRKPRWIMNIATIPPRICLAMRELCRPSRLAPSLLI